MLGVLPFGEDPALSYRVAVDQATPTLATLNLECKYEVRGEYARYLQDQKYAQTHQIRKDSI